MIRILAWATHSLLRPVITHTTVVPRHVNPRTGPLHLSPDSCPVGLAPATEIKLKLGKAIITGASILLKTCEGCILPASLTRDGTTADTQPNTALKASTQTQPNGREYIIPVITHHSTCISRWCYISFMSSSHGRSQPVAPNAKSKLVEVVIDNWLLKPLSKPRAVGLQRRGFSRRYYR